MAFRLTVQRLARHDVNPHLIKLWKVHKPMDGQVRVTGSCGLFILWCALAGCWRWYDAARHHEKNVIICLSPRLLNFRTRRWCGRSLPSSRTSWAPSSRRTPLR